jgi:hypothetical protein
MTLALVAGEATIETEATAAAEPAPFDPMCLVDREMIRTAEARIPALIDRRQRAKADLELAERDLAAAQAINRDALINGLDRTATREAVAEAATRRDEAIEAIDVLEHACARAAADLPKVKAKAGERLARYMLAEKLRIAKEMDAHTAAIAALEAEAARADQYLSASGVQFDPNLNIFQVREWRPASPPTPTPRRHSATEMEALLWELVSTGHDFVSDLLPKE